MSEPASRAVSPAARAAALPPGGAARCAVGIPGIAGRAVQRVVGLEVRQVHGDVGLAEEMRAGGAKAADRDAVGPVHVVAKRLEAPRGGRILHDVGLLDRHRDAVQGAEFLSARHRRVGAVGVLARTFEDPNGHRVEIGAVEFLDALDIVRRQLRRADFPVPDHGGEFQRRLEREIGHVFPK